VPQRGRKPPPQPHPYKAQYRHEYWFIDGRQMDFALDGVKWWSILILDGYSRTILAKVCQSAQQSADRSTQRRCRRLLAVHRSVRRWVAPASCWAARHGFLSPLVGANALDRMLRLCPHLRPPRGRERHRLRCAPLVPGTKPSPARRNASIAGGAAPAVKAKPLLRCGWRAKGPRASLDSAASPAARPTAAWPENGLGQGAGGHRWRSRWSRRGVGGQAGPS
jgi:hypothetical protein